MRMLRSHSVALLLLVGAVVVAGADPTTCKAEITQIAIVANAHVINGDEANTRYCQNFNVNGTDITGVTIAWSGGGPFYMNTNGDGSWHYDSIDYNTLVDLQSHFPTGINYQITINQLVGDPIVESLLFDAPQPNGFVPVKFPLQNQVIDPSPTPEFTWNTVSSDDGFALGCQLKVYNGNPFAQSIPYDLGNTSWTPSVESLLPDTQYTFCLDLYRLGSAGQSQPLDGQANFTYYDVFAHTNEIDFSTAAAPEPSVLLLMLSGFTALFLSWRARPETTHKPCSYR
jgi:hypothetical protein